MPRPYTVKQGLDRAGSKHIHTEYVNGRLKLASRWVLYVLNQWLWFCGSPVVSRWWSVVKAGQHSTLEALQDAEKQKALLYPPKKKNTMLWILHSSHCIAAHSLTLGFSFTVTSCSRPDESSALSFNVQNSVSMDNSLEEQKACVMPLLSSHVSYCQVWGAPYSIQRAV